jgi:hypothetical protein
MAVMGEGCRYREEGYPQGPRLRLEPWRVRATEMLVSRRIGRRQDSRGVVAPSKHDGAGSSGMGIADNGEGSVFRSMLGLGRTSGYHVRRRISSISRRFAFPLRYLDPTYRLLLARGATWRRGRSRLRPLLVYHISLSETAIRPLSLCGRLIPLSQGAPYDV